MLYELMELGSQADTKPESREMNYISEWMPNVHRNRYTISPIVPLSDRFHVGSLGFRQWLLEHGYQQLPDFFTVPQRGSDSHR
jgi:hypothetical protein